MRPREIEHAIKQHYSDPQLDMRTLANALGVEKSYLREIVNRYFACGPRCLIETVRLEQAILHMGDSVHLYELCAEIGYSTTKTFRRAFKKRTGLSPQDFRAQLSDSTTPQSDMDVMIDRLWHCCRRKR
jgi:AraC-like DNA-binding protein